MRIKSAIKKSTAHKESPKTIIVSENKEQIKLMEDKKSEIENLLAKHQQLSYLDEYHSDLQEIIVLFREECQGAGYLTDDLMLPSAFFLTYQNVSSGEINNGVGRVNWVIETKDREEFGLGYPHNFKGGGGINY